MKVTGIVRRFDDLGRIVIPKEIRKLLFGTPEKSEGMPMEIFMDKDEIIIRKYEENKDDDVCEYKIKDKVIYASCNNKQIASAFCWFNECGDYKYCPYCGKKIKVVDQNDNLRR